MFWQGPKSLTICWSSIVGAILIANFFFFKKNWWQASSLAEWFGIKLFLTKFPANHLPVKGYFQGFPATGKRKQEFSVLLSFKTQSWSPNTSYHFRSTCRPVRILALARLLEFWIFSLQRAFRPLDIFCIWGGERILLSRILHFLSHNLHYLIVWGSNSWEVRHFLYYFIYLEGGDRF